MKSPQFVVCLNNEGFAASLEVGKLYQIVPDKAAEKLGGLRVIDEDGEDYLYDSEMFCPIQLAAGGGPDIDFSLEARLSALLFL